ncbi:MAG: dethiobiotin synthase [Acidobacteriota bacterium]
MTGIPPERAGAKRGLFVTGTDTGIGKTLVSALLVAALKQAGRRAGYFKPVQTGPESDSATVARLCGIAAGDLPRPAYSLAMPASPDRAAAAEGVAIELERIDSAWNDLPPGEWIVEGAGGLLVPLDGRRTVRDLIAMLHMPLLIVSPTRLGTINHTLLTLEAARSAGLAIGGLVLNGEPDPGLAGIFARFDPAPTVAAIPPLERLTPEACARRARQAFPEPVLRRLFGQARRVPARAARGGPRAGARAGPGRAG